MERNGYGQLSIPAGVHTDRMGQPIAAARDQTPNVSQELGGSDRSSLSQGIGLVGKLFHELSSDYQSQ
jgi:hypothetical protein